MYNTRRVMPLWLIPYWVNMLLSLITAGAFAQSPTEFDIVLTGGRVMDPETQFDAIRNVGISDGRIVEITEAPIRGQQNIDASGLVVAPGFIDLHVHGITNAENEYQMHEKTGGYVIIHKMKPEWIHTGVASANTMIASDGMPYHPQAHPRTAGTFARVLGKYVREEKQLSLMEALAKMTLLPARRLEGMAPAMRFKGRLQVGCDADITVFDPGTVIDKATFDSGLAFSEGIEFVLVNGVPVVRNGNTVKDTFPGRALYGRYKR